MEPIDSSKIKAWLDKGGGQEEEEDEEEDEEEYDNEEGEEAEDGEEEEELEGMGRVEDADWDLARGDFTKKLNRSRQLASVGGQQQAGGSHKAPTTPLPAMNRPRAVRKAAPSKDSQGSSSTTPTIKENEEGSDRLSHLTSRLRISDAYDPSASAGGAVSGNVHRKGISGNSEKRVRDKSDRATVQQVLDPRTLNILFKMLMRGLLKQVNGVISTGKEANVYHASTYPVGNVSSSEALRNDEVRPQDYPDGGALALKIYKTTILVFKDRDRYISGEFRFRHGYAKHNPRKMVKLWAEKEARNLKRLVSAGIRAPRPIELRDHVLVMELLETKRDEGENGESSQGSWASPRLKDAEEQIDARGPSTWEDLYRELVASMRTMFQECRLVHADLSEYNVLYHRSHLFIIDVSQSVEHDHPRAFDFLRADIEHVDDYFRKRGGVRTLGLRKTFEWILRPVAGAAAQQRQRKGGQVGLDQVDEAEQMGLTVAQEPLDDGGARRPSANTQAAEEEQPQNEFVEDDESIATALAVASGPFAKIERITRAKGESEVELMADLKRIMELQEERENAEEDVQRSNSSISEHGRDQDAESRAASARAKGDEAVFRQAYIPQSLNEVFDPERDIDVVKQGGAKDLIYGNVLGVEDEQQQEGSGSDSSSEEEDDDEDEDEDGDGEEDEGEGGAKKKKTPKGHKHEDRDAKRERKREVKEAARERRKHKMPKAEKKKRMRASGHK
ncbi:RIO1-domain-containing protein [Acaromyces ingoldii]|uniref:Serine/threonine-protein kinase RIO1 n=1 Tax=Acaromyces ingoldii TaxID=215250 RepID=A0A316YVB2_9BASI|nr:RIO1-domain-containing protein [Acaromyces ingoldii]PWN93191.1 RIO1-domain-containing protein [Acaromyces ingoldii]